jgi:hypothetical protein
VLDDGVESGLRRAGLRLNRHTLIDGHHVAREHRAIGGSGKLASLLSPFEPGPQSRFAGIAARNQLLADRRALFGAGQGARPQRSCRWRRSDRAPSERTFPSPEHRIRQNRYALLDGRIRDGRAASRSERGTTWTTSPTGRRPEHSADRSQDGPAQRSGLWQPSLPSLWGHRKVSAPNNAKPDKTRT